MPSPNVGQSTWYKGHWICNGIPRLLNTHNLVSGRFSWCRGIHHTFFWVGEGQVNMFWLVVLEPYSAVSVQNLLQSDWLVLRKHTELWMVSLKHLAGKARGIKMKRLRFVLSLRVFGGVLRWFCARFIHDYGIWLLLFREGFGFFTSWSTEYCSGEYYS